VSLYEKEKDRYVIDTSSLAAIGKSEEIWSCIIKLIGEGRLKTVSRVMGELEKVDPEGYQKLKPHAEKIVVYNSNDLVLEAGRLSRLYPQMCRSRGSYPGPADPYVVALAKLNNHVIVSDEGTARRKMPWVCKKEKFTAPITVIELFKREGK
jgi:hypothetical protein